MAGICGEPLVAIETSSLAKRILRETCRVLLLLRVVVKMLQRVVEMVASRASHKIDDYRYVSSERLSFFDVF